VLVISDAMTDFGAITRMLGAAWQTMVDTGVRLAKKHRM